MLYQVIIAILTALQMGHPHWAQVLNHANDAPFR